MAEAQAAAQPDAGRIRAGDREGRVEDHSAQPTASTFSDKPAQLLYGLTRIRFRTCMLWVAIGQAPGLFLYSYLGTLGQLGLNLARGKTHPRVIEYWVWLGGFASAAIILVLLGRVALKLLQHVQNEHNKENESRARSLDLATQPIYVARHEK